MPASCSRSAILTGIRHGIAGRVPHNGRVLSFTIPTIFRRPRRRFALPCSLINRDSWRGELMIQFAHVTNTLKSSNLSFRENAEQSSGEDRYRLLVELSPDAIWINRDETVSFVNPAALKLLGASHADQVLGRSVFDFLHPDYHHLVRERIQRYAGVGEAMPVIREQIVRLNGDVRDVEVSAVNFMDGGERAILVIFRDITDRLRAEERLYETAQLSKVAAEAIHLGTWRMGVTKRELICSKEFLALIGVEPEAWDGSPEALEAYMHPDDVKRRRGVHARAIANSERFEHEFRIIRPTGEIRWMFSRGEFVPAKPGTNAFFYGVTMDITERKRTEEALKESELRYRTLIDLSPDAIVVHQDERIVFVNEAALRLYRAASVDMLLGRSPYELTPPRMREAARERARRILSENAVVPLMETIAMRLDGFEVEIEVTGRMMTFQGRPAVLAMVRDVTERKRAAQELEAYYEQIRGLAQRLEAAREEERQRLARELHDEFGQLLTAMRIDASWIRRKAQGIAPEIAERATAMASVIEQTQQATKRMSSELRPKVLDDAGVVPAIRALVDEFAYRNAIQCEFNVSDEDLVVGDPIATPLYRMTQEALTNIAKHANAKKVTIELLTDPSSLTLIIADDGQGLTQDDQRKPRSFGLLGMRERIASVGGELSLTSKPGRGVTLEAHFPLTPTHAKPAT